MIARRWLTGFAALGFMLGICRVAQANSLSPNVYFWPGIISISVVYAFPASLLAAFLERPFYTAAGLERRALVFSLRANFISTIVGILLIPISYPALYSIGILWCIIAFAVSCVVEISYIRRFSSQRCSWGWAVGGNVLSSAVLIVIPPITLIIKKHHYYLAEALKPYEIWLNVAALAASVAVFIAAFAWPTGGKTKDAAADLDTPAATSSGPDVERSAIDTETETDV